LESDAEAAIPPPKADPFSATVKDAEKSILIHNLNLGQSPTLNPATISSKITAGLYSVLLRLTRLPKALLPLASKIR
jgi:hypothetical protein